jgi:hypothetical protein
LTSTGSNSGDEEARADSLRERGSFLMEQLDRAATTGWSWDAAVARSSDLLEGPVAAT